MIPTYTVAEVAAKFGKSEATAVKRCTNGAWPHHKDGRFIYFTDEDVAGIVAIGQVEVEVETGQTRRSLLARKSA